jgi:glucose/mannose-6-phosphate isomerase
MKILSTYNSMQEMISSLPRQFTEGLVLGRELIPVQVFDQVVVAGMGGSALPADLLELLNPRQPIRVVRNYGFDFDVNAQTLVFAVSYSGNTEETLAAAEIARSKGAQVICMSAGGSLKDFAEKYGLAYVAMPKPSEDFQPRTGTGYILGVLVQVLEEMGWLLGASKAVIKMTQELEASKEALQSEAVQILDFMENMTPVIWTDERYKSAARIATIKIQENSKQPAFYFVLPENNHNAMISFTEPRSNKFCHLVVTSSQHPRIAKRLETLVKLYRHKALQVKALEITGASDLALGLKLIWLFDWVSLELAGKLGIEPVPVEAVEDFKALMKE